MQKSRWAARAMWENPQFFFRENEFENYKVLACIQTQNWWGDNPKKPFFEAEKW